MDEASKRRDADTKTIKQALGEVFSEAADIKAYRPGNYSHVIRVRIVDAFFEGVAEDERLERVEKVIAELPEDVQADITMVLLLTPEEQAESVANAEFEHPSAPAL